MLMASQYVDKGNAGASTTRLVVEFDRKDNH
jgi:hypothetical protein